MKCSFCQGGEASHFLAAVPRRGPRRPVGLCDQCLPSVPGPPGGEPPDRDWRYERLSGHETAMLEVMES